MITLPSCFVKESDGLPQFLHEQDTRNKPRSDASPRGDAGTRSSSERSSQYACFAISIVVTHDHQTRRSSQQRVAQHALLSSCKHFAHRYILDHMSPATSYIVGSHQNTPRIYYKLISREQRVQCKRPYHYPFTWRHDITLPRLILKRASN